MKIFKVILSLFMVALIIYNVGSVIGSQYSKFTAHDYWQNFPELERVYLNSQYVNRHPKGWIPDEFVFSYAGGALIHGTNPVLIIPDAPPLGKYLIGISTLVFNNAHVIIAIFGIMALVLLYLISNQVFKDKVLALFPPTFYSSEMIFKNQFLYTPLLDLFQLVFLLAYFYFINKGFVSKKRFTIYFIIASILLGMFISTKFFISGVTIITASLLWTIFHKDKKKFITTLFTVPISIAVLLVSYMRVFAFGYSFREFLGIQKWVFLYHQSQIILPFSVWPLLLLNKWYVWFGDKPVIADGQWFYSWPIITVLSFITIGLYLFRKIARQTEVEILMLWTVCYLGFLSFGQIFSRYFIILIPILYIIAVYGVVGIIKNITNAHKK